MLKLNASYSKKVPAGEEYSSQSYHASVEVELPEGLSPDQLQARIHESSIWCETRSKRNCMEKVPQITGENGRKSSVKRASNILRHETGRTAGSGIGVIPDQPDIRQYRLSVEPENIIWLDVSMHQLMSV